MERNLKLLLLLLSIIGIGYPTYARNADSHIATLYKSPSTDNEEEKPIRHRTPPFPLTCVISEDGISIPGVINDDIYLFEIYDTSGICIESTTSEQDFVNFIFSSDNQLQIRLYLPDYILYGYVESNIY